VIILKERDIDSFFSVPANVYPKEFGFVSMLKSDLKRFLSTKNPLFKSERDFTFFTAFRNGVPAGRIVAHIHHESNKLHNWNRSYFGFFDCANDVDIAKALLEKALDFGRSHACDEVLGNFNLTAMQQAGVVTKILKDYHYTDQVFAPVYLADLLSANGFEKTFRMQTHEIDVQQFDPESLLGPKQKAILNDSSFTFSTLKDDPLKDMMEAMRLCLNNGFSDNPMFVPLTHEEIFFQAKDMMMIIDEKITVVAKYRGKPVGVLVCIPNLNPFLKNIKSKLGLTTPWYLIKHKFQRDSAIIIFYSVYKEYHNLGLNGVMLYKVQTALKSGGYKKMGGTWIADENVASLRQAEKLGAKTMHELHLFRKALK
jgi:hypothetical protein